ncbi:MAG TPA: thioredoxin family protein [Syntrophorhabdus sp.]|nr:thioredoxin family protein [Syntrophorhabdus sp.]
MEGRKLIEIIGPGCPFCKTLYKKVNEVVAEKGIDADIEHVTQLKIVMKHFPFTPVLKVNGKVVHRGKWIPNKDKIFTLISTDGTS